MTVDSNFVFRGEASSSTLLPKTLHWQTPTKGKVASGILSEKRNLPQKHCVTETLVSINFLENTKVDPIAWKNSFSKKGIRKMKILIWCICCSRNLRFSSARNNFQYNISKNIPCTLLTDNFLVLTGVPFIHENETCIVLARFLVPYLQVVVTGIYKVKNGVPLEI